VAGFDLAAFLAARPGPAVLGVVNVTPDSFSDGGRYFSREAAVEHGLRLAREGADLLDIGGESTRPSGYGIAPTVPPEEEIARVVPVIEELARSIRVPLSVDTRKASVAERALEAGAAIVNDVTALQYDPAMAAAVAARGAGVILMHMRGTDPVRMQDEVPAGDPFDTVLPGLGQAVARARNAGIADGQVALDPGLGFGKRPEQNLFLLRHLTRLKTLGFPVAVGASRKSFVRRFSGVGASAGDEERLPGSLACVAAATMAGASIVRVHDVAATVRFLEIGRASGDWSRAAAEVGAAPEAFERMWAAIRSSEA
jgi:dihydropteroate synthase